MFRSGVSNKLPRPFLLGVRWGRRQWHNSHSTEKIQYTSEAEPSDLTYQGLASAQEKQVFVGGTVTKQFGGGGQIEDIQSDYFTDHRIVLEYGEDVTTRLYAPAGQGAFNFVSPIPLAEMLNSADNVFGVGQGGVSIGPESPPDARFTRLRVTVYNTSDLENSPPPSPVGELFRGKEGNDGFI